MNQRMESREKPTVKELVAFRNALARQIEEARLLFIGDLHELETSQAALKYIEELTETVRKNEAA